jgi:large subunit ribosomal protein L5e
MTVKDLQLSFFYFVFESVKRFPGYDADSKKYKADVHRQHILGGHVAKYMKELQGEDDEAYKRQFSKYIKLGITPDSVSESTLT